jgi:nitrogen regulatory protein PII 1
MKLIRAIVRPDRETSVTAALEAAGIMALTKSDVLGRGRQGGVQVGATTYDEIPKVQFIIALPDDQVEAALRAIGEGARTGQFGDGIAWVSPIDATYTIRTGEKA